MSTITSSARRSYFATGSGFIPARQRGLHDLLSKLNRDFAFPLTPFSVRVRASCYTRACVHANGNASLSLSLSVYRSPFVYPSRKLAYILIAFHRIPGKIRSKSPRRGSRRDLVVVRRNSDFSRHRTGRNDNLNASRRFFLALSDSSSMEDTHVDPINHRFERFSGLNYSSHKLFG